MGKYGGWSFRKEIRCAWKPRTRKLLETSGNLAKRLKKGDVWWCGMALGSTTAYMHEYLNSFPAQNAHSRFTRSCGYGISIDSIGPILPNQCCPRWQLHRRVHTLTHSPYLHSSLRFHILTNVLVGSLRLSRQDTYWKCFKFYADTFLTYLFPFVGLSIFK